jgi:hypothetical protein
MTDERILKFLSEWMSEEGYSDEQIGKFVDRWKGLRAQDALPCPVCFTNEGSEQPLAALKAEGRIEPLLCPHCRTEYDLPEPT